MKKGTKPLLVVALLLLILGFIIPISVPPAADTRVIIDHTKKVYSAPACFDDAELTNFLEEVTLQHALSLEYDSESSCTDEQLQHEKKPFLIGIFNK